MQVKTGLSPQCPSLALHLHTLAAWGLAVCLWSQVRILSWSLLEHCDLDLSPHHLFPMLLFNNGVDRLGPVQHGHLKQPNEKHWRMGALWF